MTMVDATVGEIYKRLDTCCRLHHGLRRETWREIEGKEPTGSLEISKMLTDVKYAQKAALFMTKNGLLGQFAVLSQSPVKT